MIRHILIIFLLSSPVLAQSEALCGGADQVICMANSVTYQVDCSINFWRPGAVILLKVPGIENSGPSSAAGTPTVPYWFSDDNGNVTDSTGGIWSPATALYTDERGNRAIAFELQSGELSGQVLVHINDITICQNVSDGPGAVFLEIQFWIPTQTKAMSMLASKSMADLNFSDCEEWKGYAPVVEQGDILYLVNPHAENILVKIAGVPHTFMPNQQMLIGGGDLVNINSSKQLGIVLRSHESDLNLVTINSKDVGAYILPHISNNPDSWKNEWKFAAGTSMNIQSLIFGSEVQSTSYDSGLWSQTFSVEPQQENTWMRLNSSRPSNGYFEFNRIDGIAGGASLNGLRPTGKPYGSNTLILSHVAGDTDHFWTGYALVNPNEEAAAVSMTGYRNDGTVFGQVQFNLDPGQKTVEVIGQNIFPNFDGLSWIKIESTTPLAGIELFGGQNANQPYLSGFLLTETPSARLSFPFIDSTSGWWTGISLLSPGNSSLTGSLVFYDSSGSVIQTLSVSLSPGEKQLTLAPELATQAVWQGGSCLGFALIGDDDRQYLGGYLAVSVD